MRLCIYTWNFFPDKKQNSSIFLDISLLLPPQLASKRKHYFPVLQHKLDLPQLQFKSSIYKYRPFIYDFLLIQESHYAIWSDPKILPFMTAFFFLSILIWNYSHELPCPA